MARYVYSTEELMELEKNLTKEDVGHKVERIIITKEYGETSEYYTVIQDESGVRLRYDGIYNGSD